MNRAAILLALALAGCATVPELPPATPPPVAAAFPDVGPGLPAAQWLARIDDSGLDALVARGLASGPDVEAALARLATARAVAAASQAARRPTLDASGRVTRSRSSLDQIGTNIPDQFAGEVSRNQTLFEPGVTASLDLDLFGRLRREAQAARLRVDAADADARAVRVATTSEIARNWAAARAAAARIAVARANIADSRELVAVTEARVKAGLVAGVDAARARSLLAAAEATLPPLEADRRAALAALAALTASTPAAVAAEVGPSDALPTLDLLPAAGLPSELLRRRPDIAAAERRLEAADADVAAAAAARYPRLTLDGSLGFVATALGGLFTGDALAASAGAALAGPLLDFGRVQALIDEQAGRRAEALAGYRRAVLDALAEVDIEIARAIAGRDQERRLREQVAADADAAALTRLQYRRGLVDFLSVLDAQRSLAASRDAALAARAAGLDAAFRLWRAAGGDAG